MNKNIIEENQKRVIPEFVIIKNAINIISLISMTSVNTIIDELTGIAWNEEEAVEIKKQ